MNVVVDASVVIAALMKDGRVRRVLLNPPEDVVFHAPSMLDEEVRSCIPDIVIRTGKPHAEVESLIGDLLQQLIFVPVALLEPRYDDAMRLSKAADAQDDAAYVAVALVLDAPVWTLDDDFDRIGGIRRLRTRDFYPEPGAR